jgi:hypothetical protein
MLLPECWMADIVIGSYNQGGSMVDFDDKIDDLKNNLAEKKGEMQGRFKQRKQDADTDD